MRPGDCTNISWRKANHVIAVQLEAIMLSEDALHGAVRPRTKAEGATAHDNKHGEGRAPEEEARSGAEATKRRTSKIENEQMYE